MTQGYSLQPCALAGALAAIMATIKVMRRIFDVLTRDRQLATANIVRGCPDDWKRGDGAALACMTHRSKHNQNNDVCPSSFLGFYFRDRGLVLQAEMAAAQRSACAQHRRDPDAVQWLDPLVLAITVKLAAAPWMAYLGDSLSGRHNLGMPPLELRC
jgi:hypothetical protein